MDTAISALNSMFFNGLACIFTNWLVWIPFLFLITVIILRNNDFVNSVIVFATMSVSLISGLLICKFCSSVPTAKTIIPWSLFVYLIWLLHNRHTTVLFLLFAVGFSFFEIYTGKATTLNAIYGISAGALSSTVFYWIFRFLSKNKYNRFYWKEYNTVYTKTGYLKSDIEYLECIMFIVMILLIFVTLFTSS